MKPIHVLLVDDEQTFVLNFEKLLKRRGFDVSTAFCGERALEILASGKGIQIVILDVKMPGLDGLDTLQQIREFHPGIEVIMLSGQATLEDGIQAIRKGAFDYLQKPCGIEEIEAKISAALSVEKIRQRPVLWPRSLTGEIVLSEFVHLHPHDGVERAFTIFNQNRDTEVARMLFVVDERKCVQGIVANHDLIRAVEEKNGLENLTWEWIREHPQSLPGIPVERIMNREVRTVSPDTPLAETARLMLLHHYDNMPVVLQDGIIGIVRLRDVLEHLQPGDGKDLKGD
jgi:DNA-binding response OmpR family regulator